ncbi:hypothetical protein ACSBR2_011841 [Camellia fascicularis]
MLSFAGRATLIKAVNAAILAHIMQCNFIPKSMANTIDKLNKDFLWGSSSELRKVHGVAWDTVTKPKKLGGLGIRQTCLVNKVSMAKLSWRLLSEDTSLWAKTLKSKYGRTVRACSKASPTWRNMLKGWEPPSHGTFKRNIDGAAKSPPGLAIGGGVIHPIGLATGGGVIRD